jgi:hypothetical protein
MSSVVCLRINEGWIGWDLAVYFRVVLGEGERNGCIQGSELDEFLKKPWLLQVLKKSRNSAYLWENAC